MWQRFTERARRIVFFAQEEAGQLEDNYVSSEHLLLGIIREQDSVAARILDRMGISLGRIRSEIVRLVTKGEGRSKQDMQLSPNGKRVIDLAYVEARSLSNNYIGTEHLLLGLIRDDEGLAGRVLAKLGAELERARREVMLLQDNVSGMPGGGERTSLSPPELPQARKVAYQFASEFEMLASEVRSGLQADGVILKDLPESLIDLLNQILLPVPDGKAIPHFGPEFASTLDPSGRVVVGVAETSGVREYTVTARAALIRNYLVVPPSQDMSTENEDESQQPASIRGTEDHTWIAEVMGDAQRGELIGSLGALNILERDVIMLRYGLGDDEPRTLEEVGRALEMTRERVRLIEVRALLKLRRDIQKRRRES